MIDALLHHFSALEDPRCAGKVEHQLLDIVVIAVCAVIACAESFEDMALYGRSKLSWLQQFLALPNSIPSHDIRPKGTRAVFSCSFNLKPLKPVSRRGHKD